MTRSPRKLAYSSLWILAGTLILMAPAIIIGRPFIFWDTATFYNWGHDVVAAMRHPWPPLSDFPLHRGLWAADYAAGSWDHVTPEQFQLTLTAIGARSEFYAVPLYLLGSWLTLWGPAALQATAASALLWITSSIIIGERNPLAFLILIAALTIGTSLPFYAAFMMPDIFAALGLLSAALLLCFQDRMTFVQRAYATILTAIALVVHTSNLAVMLALIGISILAAFLLPFPKLQIKGFLVIGCAIAAAVGAHTLARARLQTIFGQTVRTAPFLEGRVIADGPGKTYLNEVCGKRHFAACIYKDANVVIPDDVIWPDYSTHDLPVINDPSERRRFLNEQMDVVVGTITMHPVAEIIAATKNGLRGVSNFRIANSMGASLRELLEIDNDQKMRVLQITPNLNACITWKPEPCDFEPQLRHLQWLHYAIAAVAFLFIAAKLIQAIRRREPDGDPNDGRLMLFALILSATVVANGFICGAASGPWERYQARVIWLVPMAAGLMAVRSVLSRRQKAATDNFSSRPTAAVG